MIIYQVKLPNTQDAEVFVKFMNDEYFSSVQKGPTRVGQVSDLALLQEEPEGKTTGCIFCMYLTADIRAINW